MDNYGPVPKEIRFKGKRPWVKFKKGAVTPAGKDGIAISKDIGGLTLVGTWVRTDSFNFTSDKAFDFDFTEDKD